MAVPRSPGVHTSNRRRRSTPLSEVASGRRTTGGLPKASPSGSTPVCVPLISCLDTYKSNRGNAEQPGHVASVGGPRTTICLMKGSGVAGQAVRRFPSGTGPGFHGTSWLPT